MPCADNCLIDMKGQDLELTVKDKRLISAILNTTTYKNLFDEFIQVSLGQKTNDTVSNTRLFHFHSVQDINISTWNMETEKRNYFWQIAAQVYNNNWFWPNLTLIPMNFGCFLLMCNTFFSVSR